MKRSYPVGRSPQQKSARSLLIFSHKCDRPSKFFLNKGDRTLPN
ncbi:MULTISPECIES: hypothetical protein [unclassified Microcoleus]|nr:MULTISPECIES: hypothetical protein [unclassified Microcoleus]